MRKTIRYALMFLAGQAIISSVAYAQTTIGVKAGLNFSNVINKDENGVKSNTDFVPGPAVGFTVDIPLASRFYLQPAIQYSQKGYKQKTGLYGPDFKATVSYIELPVNLLYKLPAGKGKFLFGAGPYLAYGTGGKWKSNGDVHIGDIVIGDHGDIIFRKDAMDGGDINSFNYGKRLDYGLNALAGYEFFGKLAVQLGGQLGLANLTPEINGSNRGGKFKNLGFGVAVGYKL